MKRYVTILILAMSAGMLFAQTQLQFRSELDKQTAQVGEALHFRFMVEGADSLELPDWKDNADFSVQFEGGSPSNSTTTYSINGKVTTQVKKSYVGSFLLRPKHEGTITIQPQRFRAGGQVFITEAVTVSVGAARTNSNFLMRWSVPSASLIEGQAIKLKIEFLFAANVKALRFSFPFLNSPDITWDSPVQPSGSAGDVLSFNVGGKEWYGRKSNTQHAGRQYNSVELFMTGHPRRNGTIKLEGLAADISAKTGTEIVRDFFDRQVEQEKYEDLSLNTEPLVLSVKALPTQGKPANYVGLVGNLQVAVTLPAANVGLGDPVDLKVQVKGLQNQVDPQAEIERQLGESGVLKVSLKDRTASADGTIDYTFLVRFTKAGNQAIQPIVLDYFEPQSGSYKLAQSARIAVQVADATIVGSSNIVGSWNSQNKENSIVPDRALFIEKPVLPVVRNPAPVWLAPLIVAPFAVAAIILLQTRRSERRKRRLELHKILALQQWDEAALLQLLPVVDQSWKEQFDRLRYSPPGTGRETWLLELKANIEKELQR